MASYPRLRDSEQSCSFCRLEEVLLRLMLLPHRKGLCSGPHRLGRCIGEQDCSESGNVYAEKTCRQWFFGEKTYSQPARNLYRFTRPTINCAMGSGSLASAFSTSTFVESRFRHKKVLSKNLHKHTQFDEHCKAKNAVDTCKLAVTFASTNVDVFVTGARKRG
jgi:hypothetical protein